MTVSSSIPHAGHRGVSLRLIRYRYLLSGMCPVRSCISMLDSFLGRSSVSLRNFDDGKEASILLVRSNRGEDFHCFLLRILSFSL
jgi:hypothetical protein